MLGSFDSTKPDLQEEVKHAKSNPLEIANQLTRVITLEGVEISSPIWVAMGIIDYLDPYIEVSDFGSSFNRNPEGLSKYLYDTHDLWYILMILNSCNKRADFVGPNFKYIRKLSAATNLLDFFKVAKKQRDTFPKLTVSQDITVKRVIV